MTNKILATILIFLMGGFAFFYLSSHSTQRFPIDVLYQGSTNTNIKIFEPKVNPVRDQDASPVVRATPSLKIASCYLFKWDDSWVNQLVYWENGNEAEYQVAMIISGKERFIKEDKGGAIYMLPAQAFNFNKNNKKKPLGIHQWTRTWNSNQTVKPILQIKFPLALEAMQKFGVRVYFLTPNQFQHYQSLSVPQQIEFLSHLKVIETISFLGDNKQNFGYILKHI